MKYLLLWYGPWLRPMTMTMTVTMACLPDFGFRSCPGSGYLSLLCAGVGGAAASAATTTWPTQSTATKTETET